MLTSFSLYTVKVVGHLTPQSREHTGTEDCFSFILLLKVNRSVIYCAQIILFLPRLAAARRVVHCQLRCHAHAPSPHGGIRFGAGFRACMRAHTIFTYVKKYPHKAKKDLQQKNKQG